MNLELNKNKEDFEKVKRSNNSTRERIVEVATGLFAAYGFEGASVREIARIADVNLAAVNYHFSNKQNLYFEVIRTGVMRFQLDIEQLSAEGHVKTSEFAVAMYDMLLTNGPKLINNFKVLLNDIDLPQDLLDQDKMMGPPGAEFMAQRIAREVGQVSEEEIMWAIKVIFTFVVHTALMASTYFGRHRCPELMDHAQTKLAIKRLVESTLKEISIKN